MRNSTAPQVTVGAVVAAFLEQCGVKAAFGVISIHNMPILDAFAQRGKIRFVMARGEAGAGNMADAYARSTGSLGVCITSTGPAAGNIAGSLVEAYTAGTPLLHITGQIETPYLDKNLSYIHEAPDQLTMLDAVSKAAFRVRSAATALATLREGGARGADRADRPGQRRDPDRHPADGGGDAATIWRRIRSPCRPRRPRRSRRSPSAWRSAGARCCGSAAVRAMPASRCSA